MSHTTSIKGVSIRDVSAIHSAVRDLKAAGVNCDLVENTKPRMYYANQHGNCAYVLKLHNCPYDVGFDLQSDGSYTPVFDEFANHVSKQIGSTCKRPETTEERALWAMGQFSQNYAKHAAINAATAEGYSVQSCMMDPQGNVQLVLATM